MAPKTDFANRCKTMVKIDQVLLISYSSPTLPLLIYQKGKR